MKAFQGNIEEISNQVTDYETRTERGQGSFQLSTQTAEELRRMAKELLAYADEIDPRPIKNERQGELFIETNQRRT